jgi:hypothetical protein
MSIIKRATAAAVIAIPIAMLAACGGGGDGSTPNTTIPDGSTTTPDPTTPTPTTPDPTTPDPTTPDPVDNTDYSAPRASYAYITQRGAAKGLGSILKCKVSETDGALSDCADSGGGSFEGPISLTFSGGYAYIVNKPVGAVALEHTWLDPNIAHSIWKCSVDTATGALSHCADSGANEAVHIDDFYSTGSYAYMVQRYGDMILRCVVEGEGKAANCTGFANPAEFGLHEPASFAFVSDRFYVANSNIDGSSVSMCMVDAASGEIPSCQNANASSFVFDPAGEYNGVQPTGIVVNGPTAYIVSKANKNVISCTIGSDGKFTSCVENPLTGVSVDSLNRIALQGSYAYITNNAQAASTGSVIKCEIGAGGKLNNCAAIPGLSFDSGLIDADSNGSDIRFLFTASQQ